MTMTSPTQSPGMSELRGLLEKATPGPWFHRQAGKFDKKGNAWDWIADHPDHGQHRKLICTRGSFYGGTDDYALVVAMRNSLPTLLDDLAAAQGEIERLREALRDFLNAGGVQWMSGMATSSAWSLPKLAAASVKAHSALTLKSEGAASSPKGSDVGEVGE